MARIDNPFSLFEADDDELDPVAILARVEAKKISESNAAAAAAAAAEQDQQQPPEQPGKKDDAGGRAERGRGGGGRGGRARGAGRGVGESWGQYGDGYSRGYGGDYDGRGGRGGRGGKGGSGRGRGRGYYEYRGSGNGDGDQYGANRNQAQDGGVASVDAEGAEGQEVQGRGGYYGNRRGRNENTRYSDESHSSGWEPRGYGGEGRRYGGRGGRYERSETWNELPRKEDAAEGKNQNDWKDADGGTARDVSDNTEVPKDSENEVPKNADDEKANHEPVSTEDVSEKKNAEDDTMTLEEYEKLLFEKRKALEALKTEERKVDIDVDKSFGGMKLIEKKKEQGIFVKLKSDKDKLKKVALEKEEKARKAMSINEFLKPAEGETYVGPSYARERAARIRSERRAREEEERKHATAEEGGDVPVSGSYGGDSGGSGSYGGGGGGGGRGRGRGRGQRGGYRGEFSNGERGRARGEQAAFRGGATIPENESDKEFLDKEFPVLGGAVKA